MKTEIKVGLFVVLGLASLLLLTFQIKTLENLKNKGYVLYAIVNDASGINKKSRVKLRGVKVGIVDNMKLVNNGVKLKLLIYKNVKIPVGSMVAVAQDNVLGGKYLKIIPYNSNKYYKPGDVIKKYIKSASMEDVMTNINSAVDKIKVLIDKINTTLNNETIENIQNTIANLKETSNKLNKIMNIVNSKLPKIMDNANSLLLSYKKSGDILKSKLPILLSKTDKVLSNTNSLITTLKIKIAKLTDTYTKLGENVNSLVANNNSTIKQTIVSAEEFFKNGSNSFKKIDDFLASVNKSQIKVNIDTKYLVKDNDYVTDADIYYYPNPTKFYLVGITSRKDYSIKNPDNKSKIYINAEIGKRYDNLVVRGGIIQNTGGVGIDYFIDKDRLKLSSQIFDFNSENDIRGNNPHLDFTATYTYLKHLEFLAGIDNILNVKARNFFLGVGIKFMDNDIKPLLSGGATSFLK